VIVGAGSIVATGGTDAGGNCPGGISGLVKRGRPNRT